MGAAGPIMIGGLYTKWGTTAGAFCALIFGSGTTLSGIIGQRFWASDIYPFLLDHGYIVHVEKLFSAVNGLFSPYIVWEMNPTKFPINSYEITFTAMTLGCIAYVVGSLLTYRKPYNLDQMLHRGRYSAGEVKERLKKRGLLEKLIGIDKEYTRGDKVIAWGVFAYAIVYQFIIAFVVILIWNIISPWPGEWWGTYFFIHLVVVGVIVGAISTVWFTWGSIVDIKQMFRDLEKRVDNPLDDGWVEGHVSSVDKEAFSKVPEEKQLDKTDDKKD